MTTTVKDNPGNEQIGNEGDVSKEHFGNAALLSPVSPEQGLVMHELIYCEDGDDYDTYIAAIKARWPQATFEDGSDSIHDHRFAVTIADVERDDFFRFAMKERFAMCCLGFRLVTMEDAPRILALWKSLNVPEARNGDLARLN